ncbi:MAG: hypothetical protein WCO03_01905, partial [bacterium]
PTIILKPLAKGGNFTEQFAPIFFIQEYDSDSALIEYFETEAYAENAMYLTVFGHSEYIDSIKDKYFPCGRKLHPSKTIIHDTDLHAPGIERGVCEYGGYGRGASSVSHRGEINYRPTLPQREIFNFLVKEPEEGKINNNEAPQTTGFVITGNENYYIPEEGKDWRDTLPQMISNASVGLGHSAIEVRVTPAQKPSLAFIREAVVADQLANLTKPKTRLQINFSDLLEIENKSINSISDKEGIFNSLAKRYQYQTKLVLNKLKIITQDSVASEITTTPDFVRALLFTIKQRHLVAETVFQIQRPEVPFKEFVSDYYPVKIRSKYTGNTNTEILSYDGDSTFTYRCLETNQVETTDVTKDKGIIPRDEVLIPILWTLQDTVLTLGDTGQTKRRQHMLYSHIFKLLSNRTSPIYLGVETVTTEKITGRNAQTNKHNLLKKVFDIYDLDVLKWLMIKTEPQDQIQLTFHSDVPRLFDEYDQENGICLPSFREIHSVGQLSNWSDKTITNFISFPNIDFKKMGKRFNFVYNWAKINKVETSPLNDSPHHSYWNSIPDHRQKTIVDLRNFIANNEYSADTINQQVAKLYSHDKQLYTDTYQLLINAERGPRLSNLLYFADKNKILNLLSF